MYLSCEKTHQKVSENYLKIKWFKKNIDWVFKIKTPTVKAMLVSNFLAEWISCVSNLHFKEKVACWTKTEESSNSSFSGKNSLDYICVSMFENMGKNYAISELFQQNRAGREEKQVIVVHPQMFAVHYLHYTEKHYQNKVRVTVDLLNQLSEVCYCTLLKPKMFYYLLCSSC